jgi:hypothetical protein
MTNKELLDLLEEARQHLAFRDFTNLRARIDAALSAPKEEWDIETARNHHAGCAVYDDGGCTCGFRARREKLERSPLAVGEGTWSVFAQKVVKERDEAVAERDEACAEVRRLMREVTRLKSELARAETDKKWAGVGETGPVLFK